jgi:hypothetical protein
MSKAVTITLVRLPIDGGEVKQSQNVPTPPNPTLDLLVAGRYSVRIQSGFDADILKKLIQLLENL